MKLKRRQLGYFIFFFFTTKVFVCPDCFLPPAKELRRDADKGKLIYFAGYFLPVFIFIFKSERL